MNITYAQLVEIMPTASARAILWLEPLREGMAFGDVNTPGRAAAFLAQIAHESREFFYTEEIASGKAYEHRADLGNTQPGDGPRYKGRGPIQLTGRYNYAAFSLDIGGDEALLLEHPELVASDKSIGMRAAGWIWKTKDCNTLADRGDFLGITRRINGGENGLRERVAYYNRARAVLRVPAPAAAS